MSPGAGPDSVAFFRALFVAGVLSDECAALVNIVSADAQWKMNLLRLAHGWPEDGPPRRPGR